MFQIKPAISLLFGGNKPSFGTNMTCIEAALCENRVCVYRQRELDISTWDLNQNKLTF